MLMAMTLMVMTLMAFKEILKYWSPTTDRFFTAGERLRVIANWPEHSARHVTGTRVKSRGRPPNATLDGAKGNAKDIYGGS